MTPFIRPVSLAAALAILHAATAGAQSGRPAAMGASPVAAPPPRVTAIEVRRQGVFDSVEATSWVTRLANRLHVETRASVVRHELLFRARLDPFTPGKEVPEEVVRGLWRDWVELLNIGVRTGKMLTMDGLGAEADRRARSSRAHRYWVYHRTGEPCRHCGAAIQMQELGGRKLYWCPVDQG